MRTIIAFLIISVVSAAADTIPFDPDKPTLLAPGKQYSFKIKPNKDSPSVFVNLCAENTSEFKTAEGESYAPIETIKIISGRDTYELPYDHTDTGVPHINIADFDGDGALDFRIISAWGTGGSWYCYYRYHNGRYERWKEPEGLGLNGLPKDGRITASGRSGPETRSIHYRINNGKFIKSKVEETRLKNEMPEFKDLKSGHFTFVHVSEEWESSRLIRRIVEPQYEQ